VSTTTARARWRCQPLPLEPDLAVRWGDCLALPDLDGGPARLFVTSPPYWGLRNYEAGPAELGHGTLDEFVNVEMIGLAREARRHLHPDTGVLALIIGDTRAGSGGAGGDYSTQGRRAGRALYRQGPSGLAPGQWCGVPWRVALALQTDGWLLAAAIVWDKGAPRPEDLTRARRPGVQHEMVFVFAAGHAHRWHGERLPEPGDVWHVPPDRRRTGHQAPMPLELARRLILATTDPGDLVVDPCAGSGTTGIAALNVGRRAALFDLNPTTTGIDWAAP
jgi:hypothetical protein